MTRRGASAPSAGEKKADVFGGVMPQDTGGRGDFGGPEPAGIGVLRGGEAADAERFYGCRIHFPPSQQYLLPSILPTARMV